MLRAYRRLGRDRRPPRPGTCRASLYRLNGGPDQEQDAGRLLRLLRPDMLVLWDKGFDSNAFLAAVTDTGAQVLGRLRGNRRTPVLTRLVDGFYLSVIGAVKVRIVDAQIAVTCADGTSFTESYRLVTTLTDARRHPATALVGLYHQRWEHESAYYVLRHTITNGRNPRSGDPAGIEQEMWSLLALYQALRTVMVDAAESVPGTDPDRCCFSIALHTARDQVIQDAEPGEGTSPCTTGAVFQDLVLRESGGSLGLGRLGYFLPALLAHTPLQLVQPLVEECADLLVARIVVA